MSIQSEITRIQTKRDESFTAVAEKGVTVPAGAVIDDLPGLIALINAEPTLQSKTVNPTTTTQTVQPDATYDGLSSVTINAMPSGYVATAAKSVAGPAIIQSIESSTGRVSATVNSADYTPTINSYYTTSGYIENSSDYITIGSIRVGSVTTTYPLPTTAATTITPTTTTQTAVSAYRWTTGAVTVAPIPSEYIIPTGTSEITENNVEVDVSNLRTVTINIPMPDFEDTWHNVTYEAGFSDYNSSNPVKYRKYGDIVFVRGLTKNASEIANTTSRTANPVFTLPTGYRPNQEYNFLMQLSGANIGLVTVNTNGRVCLSRFRNGGTDAALGANSWINLYFSFLIN